MAEQVVCPHHGATLGADGRCPVGGGHYTQGARTGVTCPLCGGSKHSGQVDSDTETFQCAWRQWSKATNGTLKTPFTAPNLTAFAAWYAVNSPAAGRQAQNAKFVELASAGATLPETVVARAAKKGTAPPPPPSVAPSVESAPSSAPAPAPEGAETTPTPPDVAVADPVVDTGDDDDIEVIAF